MDNESRLDANIIAKSCKPGAYSNGTLATGAIR